VLFGLLTQSGLARFADHMAGIVYGWSILQLTGSGFWSGVVIATHGAVLVLGILFAGRLIARFGARRVAITGAWTSALAASMIAALMWSGSATPLAIALVAALGAGLDGPSNIAAETNYPEVTRLARFDLLRLNAIDDGLDNTAALVAPASGAMLLAVIGTNAAVAMIALLMLASAVILTAALPRFRKAPGAGVAGLVPVLKHLYNDRILLPLTALFSLVIAIFAAIQLVVLPLAVKLSGGSPADVASFLAAAAAGSIAGAVTAGTLLARARLRTIAGASFLGLACGATILATGLDPMQLAAAGIVTGFPAGIVTPLAITLYQSRPPKAYRADVQSIAGALILSAAPLAIVVAGFVADLAGPGRTLLAMSVAAAIVAAIAVVWLPAVRTGEARTAQKADLPKEDR
jgi:predicted MFS family arabinose efflux permease